MDNNSNIEYRIKKDFLYSQLSKLASSNAINKWDIGAYSSNDLSVQVDKGESKQLKASTKKSLTIRVWNKEDILGITSTSDYSESGIRKAFEGALNASYFGNSKDSPKFSKLSSSPLIEKENIIRSSKGIKVLLNILRQAESDLLASHNHINSVPYNGLAEANIEKLYLNSDSSSRQMQLSQASLYLYAKAEEIGRKPRSAGSVKTGYGIKDLDIEGCIKEASSTVISHLDYEPIKTDKYLVCFSPDAFLDLIYSFSSLFNARSILDGISLSDKNCLGTRLAVPFLSIHDQALHKDNFGTFTFDGEGTPKKNITLLNNGVIQNLMHSESTARLFRVDPTGHASLGAKASVSPEWFVIEKSDSVTSKFDNLSHLETNAKFVLIDELNALHAGVKASQGSFSLPFDGWLIENGIKKSIEAATVAGDIKYLLNNIVQIENKSVVTNNGVSPYIWVDNLSITGEA
tara:strand:- start:2276 stop:3658 length:1383 start_codon:yes stop_codon:yes gene_type:complete